jgi:hypothetical protein
MPIQIGTRAISDIRVGSVAVQRVHVGSKQVWPAAADSVVGRLPNLTPAEENAVRDFVDSLDGRGDWDRIIDIFCFSLNELDSLTGFKDHTAAIEQPTRGWTHSVDGWVTTSTDMDNPINTTISPSANYVSGFGSIGVFLHSHSYTGTGNHDFTGCVSAGGGGEMYQRWRGSDTEDFNIRFLADSIITPRYGSAQVDLPLKFHCASYRSPDVVEQWVDGAVVNTGNYPLGPIPSDVVYINGRNNGGAGQNSRASGYSFFYMAKDGLDINLLYDDMIILLQALGVSGV